MAKQTIAQSITSSVTANNGKFLAFSSVWNIHNTVLGSNPQSNVCKAVDTLFDKNKKVKEIAAVVGRKGRSQHSETEVLLFDVTAMSEDDRDNANIAYNATFFTR